MKHDFLTRMREIFAHFLSKLNEDTCHYINGPETLPPPLTKAEEQVVFQNIRDGKPNARDPLITHNLRLVVYIAKKFESPAVNVEDLISIGTIGLIKAVNTFSVERNIKLATYASRCIENEILMYLRKTAQLKNEISLDDPLNVGLGRQRAPALRSTRQRPRHCESRHRAGIGKANAAPCR